MESRTATVTEVSLKKKANGYVNDENSNVLHLEKSNTEIYQSGKYKYFGGLLQLNAKLVWANAIGFLILHSIALYGLFYFFRLVIFFQRSVSFYIYYYIVIIIHGQGITAGAHRLFSHKAYKARMPLKVFLLALHTIAGQNCMYIWVRDHRQHHKYTDTDADPHNAKRGFFFSHMGWLVMKKHPEVIKKGKTIDLSDLEQDPIIMFQKKYYQPLFWLSQVTLFYVTRYFTESSTYEIILLMITKYVFTLHCTWAVNSFAHLYGTKPFDKHIMPVENKCVSMMSNGEGWHNYHHSFPWDYKASEYGQGNNFTSTVIEFFAKIGWAYDLKIAPEEMVFKKVARSGDGSHKMKSQQKGMEASSLSSAPDSEILNKGW